MRISDWSSDVCSSDLLYSDKASGARDDRAGLKACLDYMNAGDTLVVWKLDRLGRSLPHLLALVPDLKERGIAFRSLTEQMDTTTPHGALLFSLFGALAQYERALTRARIMAGLAAAKRRGPKGGRPPPHAAAKMPLIVVALSHGASTRYVSRQFNRPRPQLTGTCRPIRG